MENKIDLQNSSSVNYQIIQPENYDKAESSVKTDSKSDYIPALNAWLSKERCTTKAGFEKFSKESLLLSKSVDRTKI